MITSFYCEEMCLEEKPEFNSHIDILEIELRRRQDFVFVV